VDLITSRLQDPATSGTFTGRPFTEWWCPPGSTKPIRIYGEAHSSEVAIKLYEDIKEIPAPDDHPDIQSVVILLMLGSDATHLASFGTASIWPLYVFFGNDSKYDATAYHLAFFPKVRHVVITSPMPITYLSAGTRWLCGCVQESVRGHTLG
jgi:hypothetical protein